MVSDGLGATVNKATRETVEALKEVLRSDRDEASVADIAVQLNLDESTVLRRVSVAQDKGYIKNLEERRGKVARLVLGDPLPSEVEVLPSVERLHGCTVAVAMGGIEYPPPLSIRDGVEV